MLNLSVVLNYLKVHVVYNGICTHNTQVLKAAITKENTAERKEHRKEMSMSRETGRQRHWILHSIIHKTLINLSLYEIYDFRNIYVLYT